VIYVRNCSNSLQTFFAISRIHSPFAYPFQLPRPSRFFFYHPTPCPPPPALPPRLDSFSVADWTSPSRLLRGIDPKSIGFGSWIGVLSRGPHPLCWHLPPFPPRAFRYSFFVPRLISCDILCVICLQLVQHFPATPPVFPLLLLPAKMSFRPPLRA